MPEDDEYRYLVLRNDGTALEIHCDDDDIEDEKTYATFKYTYNNEERTISMKMEKCIYYSEFYESDNKLLTYEQILSKINEDYTVEKITKDIEEYYNKIKNEPEFEEDYPGCDSFKKFEKAFIEEEGFSSIEDFVKRWKQEEEIYYKSVFGAQVTYAYKFENDKMILTEKFTGVKNLLDSECQYENRDGNYYTDASIDCSNVWIGSRGNNFMEYYYGFPNADTGTIELVKERETRSENDREDYKDEFLYNVKATYTEDIRGKTVTIKCEGKEYVCEFKGQKFIQE